MVRNPGIISPSGIYHVVVRGVDGLDVFPNYHEKWTYLNILQEKSADEALEAYAYCLMTNHAHFLLKEKAKPLAKTMHRVNTSFAIYFNQKYQRRGHLFQDRYWRASITTKEQLLYVAKYIHNNPVEAGLIPRAQDYPWSSYRLYLSPQGTIHQPPFTQEFLLELISPDHLEAVKLLQEYTLKEEQSLPLSEVVTLYLKSQGVKREELCKMAPDRRIPLLQELFKITKATVAQLASELKLSTDILYRARRSGKR